MKLPSCITRHHWFPFAARLLPLLVVLLAVARPAPAQEEGPAWAAHYAGPGNSGGYAHLLAADGAGNVYVTGISGGTGTDYDFLTVKYDARGNQIWVARYDGPAASYDFPSGLAVDSAGNVHVSGTSTGSGTGEDQVTIKYDANGNRLWVARYDGPESREDGGSALVLDGDGSVYVCGESMTSRTGLDRTLIKYDARGNQLWVARYDGPAGQNDYSAAAAMDGAGDLYVTGSSSGAGTGLDYTTIKYDRNGSQIWVARYDGPAAGYDFASYLAVDRAGNVFVTGTSAGPGTAWDFATIKYDRNGNRLWVARHDGPSSHYDYDYPGALAVDGFGNAYVAGRSFGAAGESAYAVIKYDGGGAQQWLRRYDGPGADADGASALAVDTLGNLFVAGETAGDAGYPDITTVKYAQHTWEAREVAVGADAKSRLLWNHLDGRVSLWTVTTGGAFEASVEFGPFAGWTATSLAVGPGDGKARLLWNHAGGRISLWTVSAGGTLEASVEFGPFAGWRCVDVAVGGDNRARLLWVHEGGRISFWTVSPGGSIESTREFGPYAGWAAIAVAVGMDNRPRLLWSHLDGRVSLWRMTADGASEASVEFGPYTNWMGRSLAVGADGRVRLLWHNTGDNRVSLWTVSVGGAREASVEFGPFAGWAGVAVAAGGRDDSPRLLWNHRNRRISLWSVSPTGAMAGSAEYGPY